MDFSSRELFANEQCRVVKRYDGKISDNIKQILEKDTSKGAGIKTKKKVTCDETLVNYNFIGDDRKPFYVCTWLASKSIPAEAGGLGGASFGGLGRFAPGAQRMAASALGNKGMLATLGANVAGAAVPVTAVTSVVVA